MITVHKFVIDGDVNDLGVTARLIKPLKVDIQAGKACLWMLVDDGAKQTGTRVYVTGTGHPVQSDWVYCGTFRENILVWHVWIPMNDLCFP